MATNTTRGDFPSPSPSHVFNAKKKTGSTANVSDVAASFGIHTQNIPVPSMPCAQSVTLDPVGEPFRALPSPTTVLPRPSLSGAERRCQALYCPFCPVCAAYPVRRSPDLPCHVMMVYPALPGPDMHCTCRSDMWFLRIRL